MKCFVKITIKGAVLHLCAVVLLVVVVFGDVATLTYGGIKDDG